MREYISYRDGFNMFEWSAKKLFEVQLQGVEGQTVTIDNQKNIRVIIQENTNPLNELKEDRKILIPSDVSFHRGSIITWRNEKWMVINDVSSADDNGVYMKAKIQKVICGFKWYDQYNKLHSYPAIDTNQTLYSLGINEFKLTTVDGMLKITLPDNSDTQQIQRGQRFIYKNRFAYEVTFVDLSMNGLINLTLKEVEVSPNDNLILGIADYYNRPTWQIQIKEDNLSLSQNTTTQLHATVTKDGIVVNEEIEWTSSDDSIATIDSEGNINTISIGDCSITARLKGNNDYSDSIECKVSASPIGNSYITIQGDDSVEWTVSKIYKPIKLVNGVEVPTRFGFNIDYCGNSPSIATLIDNEDNTATLIANSDQLEGMIKLWAINLDILTESSIKNIQIKGYW